MGRDPEDSYNEPAMTSIAVHPVAGALGAEISGVDLARDLSDEIVTAIRRAWLEHLVIFFRDQDLSPKQFLDFARCFGTPIEYPFVKGLEEYVAAHPVVRVHPETGRRALYVNVAHTVGFEGMTPEESAPILDYLYRHQVRPEFTCRFRWRPGSLAFWDNRCAQHNAINDYQGHRRLLHRITLAGDTPKGP